MSTLLKLSKICKRYGPRMLFQDLDLEVEEGERFFLLGPSGCGKTTLLRIVAGLDRDHQGTVEIDGVSVAGQGSFVPPHCREIGYVFQDGALWPHLTVEKHLTFAPAARRCQEWQAFLLRLTRLESRRKDYPASLSGGEAQRLALARALSHRPKLLLLDEPFRHLDRNLAVELREAVVAILKETGTTSLFVTHDQEEALSMAHRLLLMNEHGPVQAGTPEAVFKEPASPWAAAFFGPTNRFQAVCGPGGRADTPLGTFPTPFTEGTEVELLLRASQIEVQGQGGDGGIPAKAETGAFHGHETLIRCTVAGHDIKVLTRDPLPNGFDSIMLKVTGQPRVWRRAGS